VHRHHADFVRRLPRVTLDIDRPADLWAELAARKDEFADAYTFLAAMLERADFAPPFEFYAHCLTVFGGREKLLAREGPESADAIDAFLALTLDYERGAAPSLEGFLDWVARGGTEIKRDMEQGRNEVRVMTVHGAKGLEADIVILPDTTSRPGGLGKHDGLLYGGPAPLFPLPKNDAPAVIQAAKDDADAAITREHRRLLYVALTRARDRLIVCGFTGKTGANDASWYRWMEEAAHELGVEQAEGFHAIGTLAENIVTAPVATPDETPMPHWARAPAPTEPVLPNPIRPSILGLGESLTTQDSAPAPSPLDANRLLRGTLVHTLLARLPEVAPDGRRSLALQFVTAKGFTGAPGEALVTETLAVLDDPSFAPVFGPSSRAEVAIHAARPDLGLKAPITGRIDRLAVGPDQVTILDFKTSHSVPRTADDVSPSILDQMALYRAAAQAVFPDKSVVCGLAFTDGPRLIALPEALLDARMVDIATRLAAQSDPHTLTHAQALPR
jgi:ATP-dependent helicase/nuclease subunit A